MSGCVTLPHRGVRKNTPVPMERNRSSEEALLREKSQILNAIAPRVQFFLTEPRRVQDRNLAEPEAAVADDLDLDLLRECHAVGLQFHLLEDGAPQDPHAGLRIAHPAEEQ